MTATIATSQVTAAAPAPHASQENPAPRKRVLMLTHRLPYPPDRGDRIRSYHLVKFLARHVDLSIASTSDEAVWLQHHQLMSTMAPRVALQPITQTYTKLRGVAALITGRAVTPACFYRHGLAAQILQWQDEAPFDAVLTFCTGMVQYARMLRRHKATPFTGRHVLDLVDVDSNKWNSYANSSYPPMRWVYRAEARRLRNVEAGELDHFDAITVVSEAEVAAYRRHVGGSHAPVAVGNGVDLDYFHPMEDSGSKTMVFVGVLNYKPNADGIAWFVRHVMPRVLQRVPDAKLLIVGRHPTPKIEELGEQPGVEVVGSVPDVRVYLREASVVVAPLQIARGVQNKVLEAMACQRVAVCSHAAAEGIDAEAERDLVVADKPDDWAQAIDAVMSDHARRQRIAVAARQRVEAGYSWEARLTPMLKLLTGDDDSA